MKQGKSGGVLVGGEVKGDVMREWVGEVKGREWGSEGKRVGKGKEKRCGRGRETKTRKMSWTNVVAGWEEEKRPR